jgi:hypothetical protein
MDTSASRTPDLESPFLAQQYRLLLESLTDYAVFMLDPAGTIATWTPGVQQVLGYGADEFVGLPFWALFTPEDIALDRPAQELQTAASTGRSDDHREHVRKDGSRFYADGVVTVLHDDQGNIRGFCKVIHDVTARVHATTALRDSEERYRLLVESIRDYAIFLLDSSGHVASWTSAAERIKGYSAQDVIGRHFRMFFTPEDQERQQHELELRAAATTGRFEGEGWRVRKDGSRFWGDEVLTVIRGENGELRGFAKIVRDLTERQRSSLERELLYRRAQEANRLKDEFLGTVSHELRTPLNALLGWTHLLSVGRDETERQRAVEAIRRNAEIQVQLVDDLLDVSRIISGKMRLQIAPTNVLEVLNAAAESVHPAAQAKGVTLHVHTPSADMTIPADSDRLQQIVWNLLSNAIKFTPSGGRVDLAATQHDGTVEITIRDTGAGIAPDMLPFVFERFRQADSSTTRNHGGMGLGLAIVRHLVELHGGSVDAESTGSGHGASFRVRLPVAAVQHPAATHPPLAPRERQYENRQLTNVHVLVVDDDPDTREVLSIVLREAGAIVESASSAAQGLVAITQSPPDVIIADIGMPHEDGYQFINRVRRLEPERGGRAAAIALTAYARAEDRERALQAGYHLHVPKPIDPRAVVSAVAGLIVH